MLARLYGRMAGSENEVEALVAARADFHADSAESLEAVGLSA